MAGGEVPKETGMQDAVRTFGVKEFDRVDSVVDEQAEEIRLLGYTIVGDALSIAEVEVARSKIDRLYEVQVAEIGGEERLRQINDTYTVRAPLVYDGFFLGIAINRKVLAIVERLLGDYYTLMLQNALINVPAIGNEQNAGAWHRDLNYQHFVSSRPLSISALFCVDDFTAENGGTRMLTASHKTEACPSPEFRHNQVRVAEARAGSVLVFDSMLFHRGGLNRSKRVRRAINHMYTLPLIKQQLSFPQMLCGMYRDDPFLGKFLGYESESGANVKSWREQRLKRVGALREEPSS